MQPDNSTDHDDGEVVNSGAEMAGDIYQHDVDELYVDDEGTDYADDEGTNYADDEGTDCADEDEDKDWEDDDDLLYANLSGPFNDPRERITPGNDDTLAGQTESEDDGRLNGGIPNHIGFRGSPVSA